MTPAKLRLAMVDMRNPETMVGELCRELGITLQTLNRQMAPDGRLREDGMGLLKAKVR